MLLSQGAVALDRRRSVGASVACAALRIGGQGVLVCTHIGHPAALISKRSPSRDSMSTRVHRPRKRYDQHDRPQIAPRRGDLKHAFGWARTQPSRRCGTATTAAASKDIRPGDLTTAAIAARLKAVTEHPQIAWNIACP